MKHHWKLYLFFYYSFAQLFFCNLTKAEEGYLNIVFDKNNNYASPNKKSNINIVEQLCNQTFVTACVYNLYKLIFSNKNCSRIRERKQKEEAIYRNSIGETNKLTFFREIEIKRKLFEEQITYNSSNPSDPSDDDENESKENSINDRVRKREEYLKKVDYQISNEYINKFNEYKNESKSRYKHEDFSYDFYDDSISISDDIRKTRLNNLNNLDKKNIIQKIYTLNSDAVNILKKLSLDENILKECTGNNLQQQLHSESVNIIQDSADLHKISPKEIQDISEIAINQSHIACNLNKQGQTNEGFYFADAARCVVAFAKGVKNECERDIKNRDKNIRNFLNNPVGETIKLGHDLVYSFYRLAKLYCKMYMYAPDSDDNLDMERYYRQDKLFCEKFKTEMEQIDKTLNQFSNATNLEKCEMAGTMAYDLIMTRYESPRSSSKTVKCFNAAEQFKQLGDFGKEAARLIGLAIKKGTDLVSDAIKEVKKYSHFLKRSARISSAVENAADCVHYYNVYLKILKDSIKRRVTDSKYNNLFNRFKLHPALVPALVDGHPVFDQTKDLWSITDVLQNKWIINKKTGNIKHINFSNHGLKSIGWMQQTICPLAKNAQKILWELNACAKHLKYFVNLEKEILYLKEKFKNFSYLVCTKNNVIIKELGLNHLLNLDIRTFKKKSNIIKKLSGFHHDLDGYIQKNKLVEFVNKKMHAHGFYKTDIIFNGNPIRDKTFFPSNWSREKVIDKIIESLKNFKGEAILDGNYWIIESFINEGIKIKTVIDKNGHIITAYPLL